MHGTFERGKPARKWLDDIQDWCAACVHDLNTMAQNWWDQQQMIRRACDTNWLWANGSQEEEAYNNNRTITTRWYDNKSYYYNAVTELS